MRNPLGDVHRDVHIGYNGPVTFESSSALGSGARAPRRAA